MTDRAFTVEERFSLAQTCGPVAWVGERSPRHHWRAGALVTVRYEGETPVFRMVTHPSPGIIRIVGNADPDLDHAWAMNVLGLAVDPPRFDDPLMSRLAAIYPGLRPFCDGSVFDGILTSIIGQSISVAAAAITQARLASRFSTGVRIHNRIFHPLPTAHQLAGASVKLIRESGVTWRRAEGIRNAALEQVAGRLPNEAFVRERPDEAVRELMKLPLIGRWTAESTVLWGVGAPDAHPTGDVALLRATRRAYEMPDLTLRGLDDLAESWRPYRGLAARLLWTDLFGPAPSSAEGNSGRIEAVDQFGG